MKATQHFDLIMNEGNQISMCNVFG